MKCDEIQALQGAYLDSELDARTSLEIAQHLKSCPECARLFAEEQKFELWVGSSLKQGSRSAGLWERTEEVVRAAAAASRAEPVFSPQARSEAGLPLGRVLRQALDRLTGGGRGAWTALAAIWIFILILNLASRENASFSIARQPAPSPSEMRFALKQKQLLMTELAVAAETPAKTKTASPGPHTQKRVNTLRM